jgi:transposase
MGRKPIPVEPYIDKLEQAILLGATYELAAKYAGISWYTFQKWRDASVTAKEGTPLAELRNRLEQAEGRAAIGWLAKIERVASEGDWHAAAWKLERRYPEQFGRTMQKVAFTDPTGEQPYAPHITMTVTETYAQEVAQLLAQFGLLASLTAPPPLLELPTNGTTHHDPE